MIYSIMVRYRRNALKTLGLILGITFSTQLLASNDLAVLIDPGHGGIDKGGTSIAHTYEEPLVFDFSKKLQKELSALGIKSELTRKKTQGLGLEERVKLAIKKKPQIFISIHANTHRDKYIRGAEFYIEPAKSLLGHQDFFSFLSITESATTDSLTKAYNTRFNYPQLDQFQLSKTTKVILLDMIRMKTRRRSLNLASQIKSQWPYESEIREGKFFLLQSLPFASVLVELGYITNAKDYKRLNKEEERQKLAKQVAHGLSNYLNADTKSGEL